MADSTDFPTIEPSVMDNLVKEYADTQYLHTVTVSHNGTLIAFAIDVNRRIVYSVLNLAGQGEDSSQLDVNAWPENPSQVPFPAEIEQVGYSVAGGVPLAPVKIGSRKDAKLSTLRKEEIDIFLSSTARLTASAPFQVYSDGKHIFLFRQAVSSANLDSVYMLKSKMASGDLTRPDDEFVQADGKKVALVDSTLLCDRFVLADAKLVMAREVRYRRSLHKTTPASQSDALGASDMEGRPFFAPTQELAFISNLTEGCFDVLQLPTDVSALKRWQFFAFNSATSRVDCFNLEVSSEGLFNPAGTQLYTSPDETYAGSVLEREPGNCPFTDLPLVLVKTTSGHAQSCFLCKEEGDYAMADVEQWQSSAFSVELWIRCDADTLPSGAGLFSSNDDTRGSVATSFQIDSDGSNLRFICGETTQLCIDAIETGWEHVAVTYNGTLLIAYADGVETGRATVNDLSVSFKNYIIGSNRALNSTFRGRIDEVRVWDYGRSAESIASSRSVHLLGNDLGLRGYWRFDEGSGTTAYDHTNYACHAALHGSRTWVLSDCPIGDNSSIRRSSFSIAGCSSISGICSGLYFQQEKERTGYDGTVKPMKKHARVLIALTALLPGPAEDNMLALEDASQSSTFGAGVAARGIDGNTDGVFGEDWDTSKSVTHTNCDAQPWWRAKFPAVAYVDKVVVHNRTDACQDRIDGAIVRLFRDEEVVATEVTQGGSWATYDSGTSFSGIVADSVEVSLPGTQFLSLAEVQVFALRGEIASLDVAVSREGKLAQIPATPELPCLEKPVALENLIEKSELEGSARALSTEIAVMQDKVDMVTVDGVFSAGEDGVALAACEAAKQIATTNYLAAISLVQAISSNAIDGAVPEDFESAFPTLLNALEDARTETESARAIVETKRNNYDSMVALLDTKKADHAVLEARIDDINSGVEDSLSVPMGQIYADMSGLTVCGGLLKFAQCISGPRLLSCGDGRLALYFCSPGRDLMALYYNCNVKTAKFMLEGDSNLSFVCRGAGAHMNSATLAVSEGGEEGTCNLVLVNSASGIQESWFGLPREPEQIVGIMNGSIARPATVTATAEPSHLDISAHSPHLLAAVVGDGNAPVTNGEATMSPGEDGKWFADAPGSAFFFEADSILQLPQKESAKSVTSDTLTIEAWVYPVNDSRTDRSNLVIVHHRSIECQYFLGLEVITNPSGDVSFFVQGGVSPGVYGKVSGHKYIRSKETIKADEWSHVAMSYRQSYALLFNGKQYLKCGTSEMLNICGDVTIEVFLKLDDLNGPHGLLGKGRFGDKGKGVPYQLRINADGLVELLFESGKTIESFKSTRAVTAGVFHKVSVTRKSERIRRDIEGDISFRNPESGETLTTTGLTSVEFDEFFVITFYVDGVMFGSSKFSLEAPTGHDGEFHIGRCFDSRRAINSIRGVISEVRIWASGLRAADVCKDISGNEVGLVSWWPMEDNKGNISSDRKGTNHGKMQGGEWVRSPDPDASVFSLFKNAVPLECEEGTKGFGGDEGTHLAGIAFGNLTACGFRGMLEEVRVWRTLRTDEQIMDNLFSRLKGELEHLLMYYTFDQDSNKENSPFLYDNGLLGNDMQIHEDADKRPTVMLSDAPISSETAAFQSALASIETQFQDVGDSTPSVVEYADMQRDSDNNLGGVLKRCYSYVKEGKWVLLVGYKVGNLISEWLGQAQFSPQVIGFVEGAPPVPSENLTGGVVVSADNASSIDILESDSVTFSLGVTKERSYDVGFAGGSSLAFGSNDLMITAPLGIGVGKEMTDLTVDTGLNSNFNVSDGWGQEENMGKGINKTRTMSVSTGGGFESSDVSKQLNPAVGQRAVPDNMGFALVQSETADIFALRLAHNNALICFRMIPNPDIPVDWNIIPFPINERYTKQGTLDGKVGFDAYGSPVCDEAYPSAKTYGEYSYFKPKEAYAIQRNIERKQQGSLSYYQDYDTGIGAGKVGSAIGNAAGAAAAAMVPEPTTALTIVEAAAAAGMYSVDSAAGDAKLNQAFSKRDLVNTYVWTADGGFFSETLETSDVRSEVTSGNFSFSGGYSGTMTANFEVFSVGMSLEYGAFNGGGMSLTKTRSKDTEKTFSLDVNVDVPGDLFKYSRDSRGIWNRDVIDGKEKVADGKVDAYRFKTFYLDSSTQNFEDLYGKVIDPIWLNASSHPNAAALRQANQSDKKPPCWRVFHRVTYVSRILPEIPNATVAPLESAMKVQNIDSNWQLIQKLDPFIREKTGSNSEFTHAVNDTVKKYLPELIGFSEEIVKYMRLYYGMA